MGAPRTAVPTPLAYSITLTWTAEVTVIALTEDDACDAARCKVSKITAEGPYVESTSGESLTSLHGSERVVVADLSRAGVEASDVPVATEDAWREWALAGGPTSPTTLTRLARRVLGAEADPSEGQLAARVDTLTGDLFTSMERA